MDAPLFCEYSISITFLPKLNYIQRPVFDCNVDTYDALRERSPFAVDCICMVAARVRDGGGMFSTITIQRS